jgi:hypothetical protein
MDKIFPDALVECMRSGCPPTRDQISSVATHVWRDWCRGAGIVCRKMPGDPKLKARLNSIALIALTGKAEVALHDEEERERRTADARLLLDIHC